MELKKISYSKSKGVEITYEKENPKGDSEQVVFKNKDDQPLDSFVNALQDLAKDVVKFLPFLQGTELDCIDMRSVSFHKNKDDNTQVILSCCIDVSLNSPVNISTPLLGCNHCDDGVSGLYDGGGQHRLDKLIEESTRYMDGDRKNVQQTIPGMANTNEPLEDPVKKKPAAVK